MLVKLKGIVVLPLGSPGGSIKIRYPRSHQDNARTAGGMFDGLVTADGQLTASTGGGDLIVLGSALGENDPPILVLTITPTGHTPYTLSIKPVPNSAGAGVDVVDITKPSNATPVLTSPTIDQLLLDTGTAKAAALAAAAAANAGAGTVAAAVAAIPGQVATGLAPVAPALAQVTQALADTAQATALAAAAAGIISRANLSAITGADGYYRAMDTGYVYQRSAGANTRRADLEAPSEARVQTLTGIASSAAVIGAADTSSTYADKIRTLAFLPNKTLYITGDIATKKEIQLPDLKNRTLDLRSAYIHPTADFQLARAQSGAGASGTALLRLDNPKNVVVEAGGLIDGGADVVDASYFWLNGIDIWNGDIVTVKDVGVQNTVYSALSFYDTTRAKAIGGSVSNYLGHGVYGLRCPDGLVEKVRLNGPGSRGVVPSDGSGQANRNWGGIGILWSWPNSPTGGHGFTARDIWAYNTADSSVKTEGFHDVLFENVNVDTFGKDALKIQVYMNSGFSGQTYVSNGRMVGGSARNMQRWRSDGTSGQIFGSVVGGSSSRFTYYGTKGQIVGEDRALTLVRFLPAGLPCGDFTIEELYAYDYKRAILGYGPTDGDPTHGDTMGRIWVLGGVLRSQYAQAHITLTADDGGVRVDGTNIDGVTNIGTGNGSQLGIQVGNKAKVRNATLGNLETGIYSIGKDALTYTGNTFGAGVSRKLRRDGPNDIVHGNPGLEVGQDKLLVNGNLVTGLDTNFVSYRFVRPALAANLSNVDASTAGGATGVTDVIMPFAGRILAITAQAQGALSAGTAASLMAINGTTQASPTAQIDTTTQRAYALTAAGTRTFAAGDRIGAKVQTSSTYAAGGTRDLQIDIIVQFG